MSSHKNWYERIPGEKFTHPIPDNPNEVYGFCNFQNIYLTAVQSAENGAVFVEIGTMAGLSAAWMTYFIQQSKKNIKFYSIDPLTDYYGAEAMGHYGQDFDVPMYKLFLRNMMSLNCFNLVTQMRMKSTEAVDLFADNSVDFVFIDGDHSTEAVIADIKAWLPKVKINGILAGHDYDHDSVKQAVQSTLNTITIDGTSWIYNKNVENRSISTIQFSNLD